MTHEMGLHVVLLPAAARSDRGLADAAAWHLTDQSASQTWCGTAIEYGALQRRWSEHPDSDLCPYCARLSERRLPDLFG